MGAVPNKPKTPLSNFRIPTALKKKAAQKAEQEKRTLTEVVVEALEDYTQEDDTTGAQP